MPEFVNNGPDVPERLLHAHEEGRVVFFCGAGISTQAKLPDFGKLVKNLYKSLGISPNPVQKSAICSEQYDKAIALLEAGVVGGRETVRKKIVQQLTPDLSSSNATAVHDSLLTLAKNRDGRTQLVTTNFDRLFQEVISAKNLEVECFTAPLLPVPKKRWNGLIYLHGLLSAAPKPEELDQLVISSGDFGLAYLNERWAARFVSELFRNYTVCFIGYGLNDPVLRYMVDAIAADRLLGESVLEVFAFGSYSNGMKDQMTTEWSAKNVTPILYKNNNNHAYLRRTLKDWGDTYRDGVHGKEMIVIQHSSTPPLSSSRSEYAVGRMLWALTDKRAAKCFAEMNPVPPLDWLDPLVAKQFGHEDLDRFGVTQNSNLDKNLKFSFICRPVPYTLAHWMNVTDIGCLNSDWDEIMYSLGHWLTRHLNDPKLLIWLTSQGSQLHIQFAQLIRNRISKLDGLMNEGKQEELDEIQKHAPRAIPGPLMRLLWQLYLSGRINSYMNCLNLYQWFDLLIQDGLTPILRMELRKLITPQIEILEILEFHSGEESGEANVTDQVRDHVAWNLVLSSEDVHYVLNESCNNPDWQAVLPELLQDFIFLLRDALDLKKALGGADEKSDSSYIDQPSISDHSQNDPFHDWTALINLTRDAWLAMVQVCPKQAKLIAETWWQTPYPLFKRLSFFAAANSDLIDSDDALDWLLSDEHWWLWSLETKREMFRLLVSLAQKLNAQGVAELEQAILKGPIRKMYRDGIEPSLWKKIIDNEIWIRLAKLDSVKIELGSTAKSKLNELRKQNPEWQLATDESDEFSFWIAEEDNWRRFVTSPREPEKLMEWLMQPYDDFLQEDDWYKRCREDFNGSSEALCRLAKRNKWPVKRWKEALRVWTDYRLLQESWCKIPHDLIKAPDDVIIELSLILSRWLNAEAGVFDGNEKLFFRLCQRVLDFEYQSSLVIDDDPVSVAINHPVGVVTEALLNWLYRQELEDAEGLSDPIKSIFTKLCDKQNSEFCHGRVLLAKHSIALFRVDADWVRNSLLPLFDWQASEEEANCAWAGFLWSQPHHSPVLWEIKNNFLDTASHYNKLGRNAERFAFFLTYLALNPSDAFTTDELKHATNKLPIKGLQGTVKALTSALKGAGDQRIEFWEYRILPYFDSIWPMSSQTVNPEISSYLARLCIEAQEKFPDAVEKLRPWLKQIDRPGYFIYHLKEMNLCKNFPEDSLKFLDAILSDQAPMAARALTLRECLNDILTTDSKFAGNTLYNRLDRLC